MSCTLDFPNYFQNGKLVFCYDFALNAFLIVFVFRLLPFVTGQVKYCVPCGTNQIKIEILFMITLIFVFHEYPFLFVHMGKNTYVC